MTPGAARRTMAWLETACARPLCRAPLFGPFHRSSRMFGLTSLGTIHTAVSLVALFAGYLALLRAFRIDPQTRLGQVYIWSTVITCLTGFGIFQHGGFGKPHILGILTLLVLGVAALPGALARFGPR